MVVLHYQASDISADEVMVTVNGSPQGSVPSDTGIERELEQVLLSNHLKKGETNLVAFDNVRNPSSGKVETWRIFDLWIEITPVPDLPADELLRRANELSQKAREFYDLRDVGPENLFRAWRNYRQAWLTLVSLPEADRPGLFRYARGEMDSLSRALDKRCRTLMLDAKRSLELRNPLKARQSLEEVARYFPTSEHRCHNLARRKLSEYGL